MDDAVTPKDPPPLILFVVGPPAVGKMSVAQVVEEVAASDLPGLLFTFVWAFDLPEDERTVEEYARPFRERGGRVLFLELETSQAERLRRNVGESRLAEKPSKRDLEASRANLLDLDARYRLNTDGAFDDRADWLRIDNTHLSPADVAERVIRHFALPEIPEPNDASDIRAVDRAPTSAV